MHNATEAAIIYGLEALLFAYFLFVNGAYAAASVVALRRMPSFVKIHRADPVRYVYSHLERPVSVLVPAFNEEEGIVDTIASLIAQQYSEYEIIVVNDGSTDRTLQLLKEQYKLEPFPQAYGVSLVTQPIVAIYQSALHSNMRVIDKKNGGKADALNAGVNGARYPFVFSCDADSYYSPDAIECLAEPFVNDPTTVVSGGSIGVSNACDFQNGRMMRKRLSSSWIVRFQVLEYMRAFLASRMGWAPLNALCIVSGACGLLRKDVLIEVGGYRVDTIWEDMEITMRIHHFMRKARRPYRVAFTPFVVCWTRVPSTLGELWHQRVSWHRHVSECVAIHRELFMSSSTGTVGWLAFPYLVIGEWMAPLMVLLGIGFGAVCIFLGILSYYSQFVLLGLVFSMSLAISMAAILLDEIAFNTYDVRDLVSLLASSFLELFGFRQFATLANLVGLAAWFVGRPIRGKPTVAGWRLAMYDPTSPDTPTQRKNAP